jgi:hypothetical protein
LVKTGAPKTGTVSGSPYECPGQSALSEWQREVFARAGAETSDGEVLIVFLRKHHDCRCATGYKPVQALEGGVRFAVNVKHDYVEGLVEQVLHFLGFDSVERELAQFAAIAFTESDRDREASFLAGADQGYREVLRSNGKKLFRANIRGNICAHGISRPSQ